MTKKKTTSYRAPVTKSEFPQPLKSDDKDPFGGFINIRLSDEQKDAYHEYYVAHPEDWFRMLDDIVGQGAKVTVSYDAANFAYVVAITGRLYTGFTERWVMTSRNATISEAFALSMWKHFVLAGGNYDSYRPSNGSFMQFG